MLTTNRTANRQSKARFSCAPQMGQGMQLQRVIAQTRQGTMRAEHAGHVRTSESMTREDVKMTGTYLRAKGVAGTCPCRLTCYRSCYS
jgi:hypothetical protein